MARPYSLDLRERVVAAVDDGLSCRTAADTFCVSVSSVVKWSQRFRTTGKAAAKPMGGKRPVLLEGQRAWILDRIASQPDLTLRGLMLELRDRGVSISYGAVWNFVHRQGLSFKKKHHAKRTGSRRRRAPPRSVEKVPAPD
jgi:transposase